jgi:hypothetical protein
VVSKHGKIARMTRLSVMTYNILRGGRRGEALHEVVRAVAPDVLLVNECPKTPLLWKSRCEDLVDHWGMRYVAGGRPAGWWSASAGRPRTAARAPPWLRRPSSRP